MDSVVTPVCRVFRFSLFFYNVNLKKLGFFRTVHIKVEWGF